MKRSLIGLVMALGTAFTLNANAQDGFFACTTDTGRILAGSLDGEGNIENARVLDAGSADAQALKVESVRLSDKFQIELIQPLPEESVTYRVKAKKRNGISEATIESRAGESVQTRRGVCVVKFKAAI